MDKRPHFWRSRLQLIKIVLFDKSFMLYTCDRPIIITDETMEHAKKINLLGIRSYFMNCHYDPFKPTIH